MKKTSKLLLTIMAGTLAILTALGFLFSPKDNSTTPLSDSIQTSSTSIKNATDSTIFKEIVDKGLASYLQIDLTNSPHQSSIKSFKIIQTIGSTSTILTTDEDGAGKACYFDGNGSNPITSYTFYFTRPATYTVVYTHTSNGTTERVQKSCTFKPELNIAEIKKLTTVKDSIVYPIIETNDGFLIANSGSISLPTDNNNLYTITASTKGVEKNTLKESIPDNSFGTITYTIKSSTGKHQLSFDVTVLTIKFDIELHDALNNIINKDEHKHENKTTGALNGYVFNEAVKATIKIASTATNLNGTLLADNEDKLTALSLLNFSLEEERRDDTNTFPLETLTSEISASSSDKLFVELKLADHSIFSFKTRLNNTTSTVNYKNDIPLVKIITKVPVNTLGKTVFSIIPTQGINLTESNYLTGILNGYLEKDTPIYSPNSKLRIFYNTDAFGNFPFTYSVNSAPPISLQTNEIDLTDHIKIFSGTNEFSQFYSFTFVTTGYKNSNTFYSNVLSGNISYYTPGATSLKTLESIDTGSSQMNLNTLTSFEYSVPDNYTRDFIPTHIRVTHNGTIYNITEERDSLTNKKIYELKDNSKLTFNQSGEYSVEFYNLPSYEYITANLENWRAGGSSLDTRFYFKVYFTITGASIKASTTNSSGEHLTISNNMYSQNTVNCKVNLNDGDKFVVYKNGNKLTEKSESRILDISDKGTWKISILNHDNAETQSLTFTVVDSIYQGFSINEQVEYSSLKVSKLITSMPVTYEELDHSPAYHLTQSGIYKIDIEANESLNFKFNNSDAYAHSKNYNSFTINITKSYFNLSFSTGSNGDRVSESIIITSVGGVQLQELAVLKNGKLIKTFSATELQDWEAVVEMARTFSENGRYTFRITDKFGNTYEAQIEKYYKVNVALVILLLIIITFIVVLIVTIIKTRHKINVK